jgi:hypothetical protein
MYYVIDAIRWSGNGHLSHVRWHGVEADDERGELRRLPQEVVPVVDAAKVCDTHEVRVFVHGQTGRFFRMKACPEGLDAEADPAGAPLRERLAHLPTF